MALLEIENLSKTFGTNTVLHQFDMQIERGEFITFLGPSGCGKTTVLRMIAGFETPTRGTIKLGGRDVTICARGNARLAWCSSRTRCFRT
jgi:putative spermidine/putrescine transport system ATP-binding protein